MSPTDAQAAVFDALDGAKPEALRTLAGLLRLAGGSPGLFATPVDAYADVVEEPSLTGSLANLAMRRALRLAADDRAFVARLEHAYEPFWRAVRVAIFDLLDG
jgi:hypothetical protein